MLSHFVNVIHQFIVRHYAIDQSDAFGFFDCRLFVFAMLGVVKWAEQRLNPWLMAKSR